MSEEAQYASIAGLQASQSESIDALRASFQHLGRNDDDEPIPLRPAQPRPLPEGLEHDEPRSLVPPREGGDLSRAPPLPSPSSRTALSAAAPMPLPPPPSSSSTVTSHGRSATPQESAPKIEGFEAADFEAAGLAPPPSMEELMDQFRRDLAESGMLEEMAAMGEVPGVASLKSTRVATTHDDLIVPVADDDVEASVQLLEEGEDTGRLFALEGSSQDEAPDLLADNFVDDEAEADENDDGASGAFALESGPPPGSVGLSAAATAETSEEEDEALDSAGPGPGPGVPSIANDTMAGVAPPLSRSSSRGQRSTMGGMRPGFLDKPSSAPKTPLPHPHPQRNRCQRNPRVTPSPVPDVVEVEEEEGGGFDISGEPVSDPFLRQDVASVDEPATTIRTDADSFVESLRKKAQAKQVPDLRAVSGVGVGAQCDAGGFGGDRGQESGVRPHDVLPSGQTGPSFAANDAAATTNATTGTGTATAPGQEELSWEEPLEAFELDPEFDYDGCKLTPKIDMDQMAREYERTGVYPAF